MATNPQNTTCQVLGNTKENSYLSLGKAIETFWFFFSPTTYQCEKFQILQRKQHIVTDGLKKQI